MMDAVIVAWCLMSTVILGYMATALAYIAHELKTWREATVPYDGDCLEEGELDE